MSITFKAAEAQILSTFKTYWDANIGAINLGYTPLIFWPDIDPVNEPDPNQHFVRISNKNLKQPQVTLKAVQNKYEATGIVTVELYFSKNTLKGDDRTDISVIARDAYRSAAASSIAYRNVNIARLDPEEDFFRTNVVGEYVYDEVV